MEPPPRLPPALPEEIVEEILVRFPPEDPASLVRAVLVCKPWCRLVSSDGFSRRFRQFHRTPPVLGLVYHEYHLRDQGGSVARFVPTSTFRPPQTEHRGWRVIDARHGRVLLRNVSYNLFVSERFVVWDPVTNERQEIPQKPPYSYNGNASVLCAATSACDHLDCHRGHFLVVLVEVSRLDKMPLWIYSSKTGGWSQPTCVVPTPEQYPVNYWSSVALVGNTLYQQIDSKSILKYDLATHEFSVILQPSGFHNKLFHSKLITMEDGGLGVARVDKEAARLSLWSLEANPNGDIGWTQTRVMDLDKLFCVNASSIYYNCIGFALGIGVLFMGTQDGLFQFDMKSGQVRKVCEETCIVPGIHHIVPYISFCTPAAVSTCEGPSTGA